METDKTTLNDLSIFNAEDDYSVFNVLNFTRTSNGKEQLKKNIRTPLSTKEAIEGVQQTVRLISRQVANWPMQISNGTVMVVERFYETSIDPIPAHVSSVGAMSYKLLHGPDYSLVKYSITHCFDLIKGMKQIVKDFLHEETPLPLQKILQQSKKVLDSANLKLVEQYQKAEDVPIPLQLQLGQFLRYHYKQNMLDLIAHYAQLDAWHGMAMAATNLDLVFPEFIESKEPLIEAEGLYHILLNKAVPYDVRMNRETNFLFLTGANMAGKSTFIKAVGTAVFLAHVGMPAPAKRVQLSVFDGLLSNINVIDNIVKGESYFFNEVQRIKATVSKINDGRKWLILIDELFKGTNVQDAMKCSTAVIEGLLKINNSLFILSTHLYEIGEALKIHPNLIFNYFETTVADGQLSFSYQLRNGISNDRLGYLILQREGVVKMLEDL
jgi:DNA mismatch repair ATPase MutS